jgi:hypothetical protein
MASLRKKHQATELPPERDLVPAPVPEAAAASVAKPDVAADISPPADAAPAAPVHPVEDEEKTAMRRRLQEMEAAQHRVQQLEAEIAARAQIAHQLQQAQQPPPDDPVEAALAQCGLPPRAQQWLRQHPEYILDREKNAELQFRHWQARREAGEDFSDRYYDAMERMLGLAEPANVSDGNNSRPTPADEAPPMNEPMPRRISIPQFASEPMPAPAAQPAPPRPVGPPVSAPPHREAISMSNGRRPSSSRVVLSADQREIAWAARSDLPRDQAEELYAQNLMRMQRLKASGAISDG